jgi:hypothetical protein
MPSRNGHQPTQLRALLQHASYARQGKCMELLHTAAALGPYARQLHNTLCVPPMATQSMGSNQPIPSPPKCNSQHGVCHAIACRQG